MAEIRSLSREFGYQQGVLMAGLGDFQAQANFRVGRAHVFQVLAHPFSQSGQAQ